MKKILIFGNSGSGKTTLASKLAKEHDLTHLDLDTVCWKSPGVREDLNVSIEQVEQFIQANPGWVIEGCYGSLLAEVAQFCDELYFLNPGIEACVENNHQRPWEPHKYASKEAQDKNLEMLQNWVKDYETRNDEFSLSAHQGLYDNFGGNKYLISDNKTG